MVRGAVGAWGEGAVTRRVSRRLTQILLSMSGPIGSDLPQQTVIFVVRTYPEPNDVGVLYDAYGAIVYIHAH